MGGPVRVCIVCDTRAEPIHSCCRIDANSAERGRDRLHKVSAPIGLVVICCLSLFHLRVPATCGLLPRSVLAAAQSLCAFVAVI